MDSMEGVRALLQPRSVAIVGASPRLESLSGRPLANLVERGFRGTILPINPRHDSIAGLPCYPDVASLPQAPDLALVMVGADQVFAVLDQAVARGVKAAIVFGSGFAELGGEGTERQRALGAYARRGLRICGPNCNGVFNVGGGIALGFSPAFERAIRPGGIALLCQSGAVATSIASRGTDRALGFSHIIAAGNEADLEVSDFAEFLIDDPATTVIAMFVEGLKDVPRFLGAARRALEAGKPIVMMKVGRTAAGERVALSHTGSIAGAYAVLAGALRQQGVVLAEEVDDLLDIAQVFATGRRPAGGGLAIASISGGMATVLADAAEVCGVALAAFDAPTRARLAAALPAFANIANPLDVTGQVVNEPAAWVETLSAITADEGVDAVLSVMSITANRIDRILSQAIVDTAAGARQLQLCAWTSGMPEGSGYEVLRDAGTPVFFRPEMAIRAVAAWRQWWSGRDCRLASRPAALPAQASGVARGAAAGDDWALLQAAGIAVPTYRLARTLGDLDAALAVLHLPLVVKLQLASVRHKTELGAVLTGIASAEAAREAFGRIAALGGVDARTPQGEGVLLQEMARGRRELIVSARREAGVGIVAFLGIGGIFSEVFRDTAARLAPVSAFDVAEMIRDLRGHDLFGAVRGMGPVRAELLAGVLAGLAGLLEREPGIEEIEINPLIVSDDGATCTAVDSLVVRR